MRKHFTLTLLWTALCCSTAQAQSSVFMHTDGTTTADKLPSAVINLTDWKLNIPIAGSNGFSKEIVQPELNTYADE